MLESLSAHDTAIHAPATGAAPHPVQRRSPAAHASSILAAAHALLPTLETGHALDATHLRSAMTEAFAASDADGAWVWKDAYEASECAIILFLQRYGRAMRREAGTGPGGPAAMLEMLRKLAALEPSQTRRSEDQLLLQQFSTPLPLAYAALQAASIRPGDVVLEPSAGTGMLAVMAQCALAAQSHRTLHLNEIAPVRLRLLAGRFPHSPLTAHNAESIADRLPELHPTVIIMNPPFSVSPGIERARRNADLHHIRSAASMLPPGGRLVAISSSHCSPSSAAWAHAFATLDPPAHAVFTSAIDGRAYARRGTSFETRITVLDRASAPSPAPVIDTGALAPDSRSLLSAIQSLLPPRLALAPAPNIDLFGVPPAAPRPAIQPRKPTMATPEQPSEHDWGAISELEYTTPSSPPAHRDNPDSGPYAAWHPHTVLIPGAEPHPTPLVQSAAMAAVPHPTPSYRPLLPESVILDGLLSDAQIESVVLAGDAHRQHLQALYRIGSGWETVQRADCDPSQSDQAEDDDEDTDTIDGETFSDPVRFRRGWMLGDGTGTGKGRQVAAVVLDQWLRGRRRALWLSHSDKLVEDARRDWAAIGGRPEQIVPISKFRQGAPIPHAEAILFATYATLRSPARQGKTSRLEQIVAWLAAGTDDAARHAFAGVIVMDEAHAMANAAGGTGNRGAIKPSQQGRAGLRLQNALPDARIVYVSATGASTIQGLAYATRLGLWATIETPFDTRNSFVQSMDAGGVAAMEVVARDLKALGLYQARILSYDGIEVDILEHRLTPEQRRIYDDYANAFKIIHKNIKDALEVTGIVDEDGTRNRNAKSAAISAFEGAKQRFFGHLLTSMKCPSTIRAIDRDLERGRSAVIQLVSTGEALMERRIADIPPSEWDDLSIDLTPREYVLDYLQHAFPVQLQEPFTDDEGNLHARPVFDDDNNPVLCQEAVAKRDALIQHLAALPPVTAALDQIMHRFGHDAVAEVTGRSRRVLRITDSKGSRLALRSRPASANLAETASFMDRSKRILIFSMAGGTGRSYHADLGCPNTDRRVHYLLEPGWRADQAIQGLGRTHRTHQASSPLFRPVATDVKGERRFIATIARRLDSLGAITRGQRDSQTAMGTADTALFRASDNLESPYAKAALRQFYLALWAGRIDGWSAIDFEEATGLNLTYDGGLKEDLPPMPQFLNRLLALPIDEQNTLFAALETRIDANIASAMEDGTFNLGVETVRAESLRIAERETVFVHPTTGAETEIAEIVRRDRLEPLSADDAIVLHRLGTEDPPRFIVNGQSNRAALILPAPSRMLDSGDVETRLRLIRPRDRETLSQPALTASNWSPADENAWRTLWDTEIASLPSHTESRFWIVAGLLLPIWDRLPQDNLRVRRLTADDGEQLIGRTLRAGEVRDFRAGLGLDGGPALSGEELHDEIMLRGVSIRLANGWRICRRRLMGTERIEIDGPNDSDLSVLKRAGCVTEIVTWRTRVFAPNTSVLERVIEHWPIASAA